MTRRRSPDRRGWTYHMTPAGAEFVPIVMALGTGGQRWTRRELAEYEIDLGLLLWALEKGAHPEHFGDTRTIVEFDLPDQPESKRHRWFLNERGRCELCPKQPDHDAQLHIAASLRDLIRIWQGDLTLSRAINSGHMEVHGTVKMRKAFQHWLGISSLAHIGPAASFPASRIHRPERIGIE